MTEKEEEDLEIDFSKITKFFKGSKKKKKEHKHSPSEHSKQEKETSDVESEDDEDISIDFSKVKKFFKADEEESKPDSEHEKEHHKSHHKEHHDKKESKNAKTEEDSDDEDIGIDFSNIKKNISNLFKSDKSKKHKTHVKKEGEEDEDLNVDFASIAQFVKKHATIFLILIPVFFCIFFRMYPAYLPITDIWAESSVNNYYQSQIEQQINTQYPNLPDANKQKLVDAEYQKFLAANKEQVKQQIEATSKQFKTQFQDDAGQTYLLAIDPYSWYYYAKNWVENGNAGNAVIDGVPVETLRKGRINNPVVFEFHPYVMALHHKIFRIFSPGASVMKSVFYFPMILATIAVILAFFLGRIISGSNIGGLITSLFIAIHSSLLPRTTAGFSDNDVYHLFFPIMIALLFIYAFKAEDIKKKLYYGAGCGAAVGLYSIAYHSWWYMFDFILGAAILFIIFSLVKFHLDPKEKTTAKGLLKEFKEHLASPLIVLVCSFIFLFIFNTITLGINTGLRQIYGPLKGTLWFIQYKSVGITTIWPNVLTTVAELNTGSMGSTINALGGPLMFFFSLVGIIFLLMPKKITSKTNDIIFFVGSIVWFALMLAIRSMIDSQISWLILVVLPIAVGGILALKRKEEVDMKSAILVTLWLLGTIYASLTAIRFNALVTPVFAIAFGTFFAIAYLKIADSIAKGFSTNKNITRIVIFVLFLLLFITPMKNAAGTARSEIPSFNDAWYATLTKIKDNSTDAIITSWWDFGHWFYSMSGRRVTFDGGDQGRRIHWVGHSLTTSSEDEAVGILRMLNCVQEAAPDKLTEFTNNTVKAIDILYQVFPLDTRDEAKKKYIENGLTDEQAEIMLDYTHCTDLIPQFYITSQDMVGKSGVWSHFGNWDFHRASMFNKVKGKSYAKGIEILTQQFNLSESEADTIFYEIQSQPGDQWITDWPNYVSGVSRCEKNDNILTCVNRLQNGQTIPVEIDLKTYEATIPGSDPVLSPASVVYVTEKGVEEKKFTGDIFPYSIILVPDETNSETVYNIWAHPKVANSIFTRLFFLEGHGLKHFKRFDDRTDVTGARIMTWTVNWEPEDPIKYYFVEKEEVKPKEVNTTEKTEEPATQENISQENKTDEN